MTEKSQKQQAVGSNKPSHQNRYLFFAVVAFVGLLTIYILKTTMAPPPNSGNSNGPPPAQAPSSETAMQQATEQIEHLQQLIEVDSTNFAAWEALGNLYFDANMPEEAIAHYRQALTLMPTDINVLTDLATMYRALKQPDSAIAILNEVVAIDSTWQQAWFNLGVIYNFDLKDQPRALASWRRFLVLNPVSEQSTAVLQEIQRIEAELGE